MRPSFRQLYSDNIKYQFNALQLGEILNMANEFIEFLRRAFWPIKKSNPRWNVDAIVTLIGVGVWGFCAVGEFLGLGVMPTYVSDIGQIVIGVGLGRASKRNPD